MQIMTPDIGVDKATVAMKVLFYLSRTKPLLKCLALRQV